MRKTLCLLLALAFLAGSTGIVSQAAISPPPQSFLPLVSLDRDLIAFTQQPDFTNYPPPEGQIYSIGVIQANGSGYRKLTSESLAGSPSWSPAGERLVYKSGSGGFFTINADGSGKTPILVGGDPVYGWEPDWAPSADWISFWKDGIHILDLDQSTIAVVPNTTIGDWNGTISPDGARLAHTRYVNGLRKILIQDLDGTDKYVLPNTPGEVYQPAWSPDGEWIAFPANLEGNIDLYRIRLDGTGLEQVTHTPWPYLESEPTWSPDGNRLAFTMSIQNEGKFDIYVINVDGTGLRKLVANAIEPDWSP